MISPVLLKMESGIDMPQTNKSPDQNLDYLYAIKRYEYQKVYIPVANGFQIVNLSEIDFLQAEGNYARFKLQSGVSILTSKTLKYWEDHIQSPFFFRCHKSYLVNKHSINELNLGDNSLIINDSELPISRSRKSEVLKEMMEI